MQRSPVQWLSFSAAWLFGLAPLGVGLLRAVRTDGDRTMLWMALLATVFAAGVLSGAVGRRRTRSAMVFQSTMIFAVATLLAAVLGYALGATALPGLLAVAVALGGSLAVASVLVAYGRPDA